MRKILTALPVLLLAGCINDSATYYADSTQDHTLTVRRQQEYFWSEEARYTLMAARLPDCQRQIPLEEMPLEDVEFELFSNGDNHWALRSGKQVWQVDTQTCGLLPPDGSASGQKVGVYRSNGEKMVFEPAEGAEVATPTAPGQAPAQPAPAAPAAPDN